MGWKEWPYWLKYGLIGAIAGFLLTLIWFVGQSFIYFNISFTETIVNTLKYGVILAIIFSVAGIIEGTLSEKWKQLSLWIRTSFIGFHVGIPLAIIATVVIAIFGGTWDLIIKISLLILAACYIIGAFIGLIGQTLKKK